MTEREFTLKHIFTDVEKFEKYQYLYSPEKEHFGVKWKICIKKMNEHLAMFLYTNVTGNQEIHTNYIVRIFSKNREKNHSSLGVDYSKIMGTAGVGPILLNGELWKMNIWMMENWKWKFIKGLQSFGEEMKQFSDVTLKVKERKFYISKLYLSSHSPYFATLFLGRFQESEKSEIELKDVNPQDFQYYLEVLHLENAIDDDTVQGILSVAYLFDTPKIVKKCEEFLVKESKKGLKEKLEMAGSYRLEELKKMCLNQIKSKADISSVIPADPMEMDPKILAELFKKALVFN
ncbi:Protein CBG10347 [Caenorhabditis briggsae]|uniref:Protein CBG10347 n=1 Tax=Caenorhabditis briggsae TaxID=6238 RepID=A8XAJ5_CAEBR|nr:Protein CBG10347 [Caenorhabditis briggsae]CAP29660.1 Protein CBG10347 [Caenorhabditis briggsae]